MRHHDTLYWPQNAGNAIFEDHNFQHFLGEDAPEPLQGTASPSRTHFSKILYRPSFLCQVFHLRRLSKSQAWHY